jgi:uncharacterized protein (DUF1800 family)
MADLTAPDQIDPAEAWKPWRPSAAEPWDRARAAHLYRRAAFGASREELLEAERLGPEGTLDLLLRGRPGANDVRETLNDVGRIVAARDDNGEELRSWWLYCMLQSSHPLLEKLTLFWHNHFATSLEKVRDPALMYRQNCLLRTHALGRFDELLRAIGRDPAMLVWLDSNSNAKEHPNENYARELMELFSLGVGNYTEKDVREAARAFTGWHTTGAKFRFNATAHDGGTKTFLGQTGDWNGDDVVRIILTRPACARFVVRKLYRFLISETADPSDALLEPLCQAFRAGDYELAPLLRTMISSRLFQSDHAFRRRVKGPVEYVLGAVRAVYHRYDEADPDYRPLSQQTLVKRVGSMGQPLFTPPNVKGWPGGRSWLNTSTLLERDNFAHALATGTLWSDPGVQIAVAPPGTAAAERVAARPSAPEPSDRPEEPAPPSAFDPARLLEEEKVDRPEDVVRVLLDLYLPDGVRPAARARLVAFVAEGAPAGSALARRVREAVHALMTMPEYHLA